MNNRQSLYRSFPRGRLVVVFLCCIMAPNVCSQDFDFDRLQQQVRRFTVIVDMKLEISFGIHTSDQQVRYLGTVVSTDGLVMFNGVDLGDNQLAGLSPVTVKVIPTRIEVTTLDGDEYDGEYLGVDRFTEIGFIRITGRNLPTFTPVEFDSGRTFGVGEWLALFMLLPEFATPPLAADIGMISAVVESPELFPLTVGYSPLQTTSVLFAEDLRPVGVLGTLADPSRANTDAGGMLESFNQFGIPMLGVVTGERLAKLIADPPVKGQPDRGWLGVSLQALTEEMAQFWGLDITGGIIVNDIITGSPAERAGLQLGDIVYRVDGNQVVVDKEDKLPLFQRLIAELGPGVSVELSVLRRSETAVDTLTLTATLQEAPLAASDAPTYEVEELEFKVRSLVFADYLFHNLQPNSFAGVVISELKQGGPADVGGLQPGDIIQSIGNVPTASLDEFQAAAEAVVLQRPREVIFFVWRYNKTLFINVKTDWSQ
ncbi:MAG: PDZ domain-containing protein [bacterium]